MEFQKQLQKAIIIITIHFTKLGFEVGRRVANQPLGHFAIRPLLYKSPSSSCLSGCWSFWWSDACHRPHYLTLNSSVVVQGMIKLRPCLCFRACGRDCVTWKAPCRKGCGWFVKLTWLALLSMYITFCKVRHGECHKTRLLLLLLSSSNRGLGKRTTERLQLWLYFGLYILYRV